MQTTTKKKKMFGITIVIAAVIVLGVMYLRNSTTAQIKISSPTNSPARVFINQKPHGQLAASSTARFDVPEESTEVLISSPDTYPWQTTVTPAADSTTHLRPFLIPRNPQITREVPEPIQKSLQQQAEDPADYVVSEKDAKELFIDDSNRLIMKWTGATSSAPEYTRCQEDGCGALVYDSKPVTQVAFYPDRSDVALIATPDAVYAIEIDPSGETQNFQPIVEDVQNPHFLLSNRVLLTRTEDRITTTQL